MSLPEESSGPQFRATRPVGPETVRTTIVGGRPPGDGQGVGDAPRGIEVLVKKASVDPAFCEMLLLTRGAAAATIGLQLEPAETLMLAAVPADQLAGIIARATVPAEHRRAFLGQVAATMLVALGAGSEAGAGTRIAPGGVRPDLRPAPAASEPTDANVKRRVIQVVATRFNTALGEIRDNTAWVRDLHATAAQVSQLRTDLEKEFKVGIPDAEFQKIQTVEQTVGYVQKALHKSSLPPWLSVQQRVYNVVAKRFEKRREQITSDTAWEKDLHATAEQLAGLRADLEQEFGIHIPESEFKGLQTVEQTIGYVEKAVKDRPVVKPPPPFSPTRGIRPDLPPSFGVRPS